MKLHNGDFGGLGFAVGRVRGLRAFGVAEDGTLTGAIYQQRWHAGVNQAVCYDDARPSDTSLVEHIRPEGPGDNGHMGRHPWCGFHAYWEREHNGYHREYRVDGIVDGFGEVVIGSRGFRAEKARIVALALYDVASDMNAHDLAIYHRLGRFPIDDSIVEQVARHYPSVPVFPSLDRMLDEFPPDKAITQ